MEMMADAAADSANQNEDDEKVKSADKKKSVRMVVEGERTG